MKWFMSYVQVYSNGRVLVGSTCLERANGEHPVATVNRWNATHGRKDGFQTALLSFQQVPDDTPDMDAMTPGISS